ncbi:MAG: hypothetical protein ACR2RV_24055 [Verrucomicrobiales bacterium]
MDTRPDRAIRHFSTSTRFTSPMGIGDPAVKNEEHTAPAATWLTGHRFCNDTNLQQGLKGDGVPLLMAYALDLDPNLNLLGSLPLPVVSEDSLSISHYAAADGITYTVQTSTDLRAWTTDGVTLSEIGADGQQTATVSQGGDGRFLRVKDGLEH